MGLFDFLKPAKPITYEIRKIDGLGYVPVYHERIGGLYQHTMPWCLRSDARKGIAPSSLSTSDRQYFHKTEAGAGKVISLHSQLRGGKTVWSA